MKVSFVKDRLAVAVTTFFPSNELSAGRLPVQLKNEPEFMQIKLFMRKRRNVLLSYMCCISNGVFFTGFLLNKFSLSLPGKSKSAVDKLYELKGEIEYQINLFYLKSAVRQGL